MDNKISVERNDERGAVMLLLAVALVGLIGVASLAVDIGSALVTKAELQNVADAGALSGAHELALIYGEVGAASGYKIDYEKYSLSGSYQSRINDKVNELASANKAGGIPISVGPTDIIRGTYDINTGALTPGSTGVRAISVTARRDETSNGMVQTHLGRVLGINEIAISAQSAAAISAAGVLRAGTGDFPIGLDEAWFDTHACDSVEPITLYPTSDTSCAGWHTFTEPASSARELKDIIGDMIAGKPVAPEIVAGDTIFQFNGGQVDSAMQRLVTLFNSKGGPGWTVNVPVYENYGCRNIQGPRKIVGFARVKLLEVKRNPNSVVRGEVVCGVLDGDVAVGGNPKDFGTLVSTPGMIQ